MVRARGLLRALAWWSFLLLVMSVMVRSLLVEPYQIASGSMEPTLAPGQRVLVQRWHRGEVHRGDVVAFDGSRTLARIGGHDTRPSLMARLLGEGDRVVYVKRVIGVGGDEVACCGPDGRLVLNGEPLDEPYLTGRPASAQSFAVTVPPGRMWVMGDHREVSVDSRALLGFPGGGTISHSDLLGRVILDPDHR